MKSKIELAAASFVVVILCAGLAPGQKVMRGATTMPDGDYKLSSGGLSMTVSPDTGARITSLKQNGCEFLTGPQVMAGNYGSTFWPSPQSSWSWPPPAVIDSDPYSSMLDGDTVTFVSGRDARTGLQVVKKFYPAGVGRFHLQYTMTNISDSVIHAAPWEITRVHKGGLLFFPVGDNALGKKSFDPAPVRVIAGVAWYKDHLKRPDRNLLTTADGTEGWAAYAIDGRLFVKKFPNIPESNVAPGEGEIAFYVSKEANYVEFEIQGAYKSLRPEQSSSWNVEWIVSKIPAGVSVEPGSAGLLEFARGLAR